MSSPFKLLPKVPINDVFKSEHWDSNDSLEKYDIPVTPKAPTGKGEFAPTEAINRALYEPGARLVGFKISSKERLIYWIKAISFRYHGQMGSMAEFLCEWKDRLRENCDSKVDEIFIQLFNAEKKTIKYLTIHIYLTTHYLTVQGTHYVTWAADEFDFLKSIVDALDSKSPNDTQTLLDITQNITNYDDFFSTLDDNEQTEVKKVSTPRIVAPVKHHPIDQKNIEHIQNSIQGLETTICDLNRKLANTDVYERLQALETIIQNKSHDSKTSASCDYNVNLKEYKDTTQNQLQDLEHRLGSLESSKCVKILNMQQKLDELESSRSDKIQDLENRLAKFESYNDVINKLEQRLFELESAKIQSFELRLAECESSVLKINNNETIDPSVSEINTKTSLLNMESENTNLKKINEQLQHENDQLKKEINSLKAVLHSQNDKPLPNMIDRTIPESQEDQSFTPSPSIAAEIANETAVPNVTTSNRFAVLSDTDDKPKLKKRSHEVELVIDSHGNGIQANRMYRNKDFNINVLGPNKKNIAGVNEFVDNHETPKHLIIGIGNNDISSRPLSECMEDMNALLQKLTSLQNCTVHLLPCFERIGKETFNQNVSKMNILIKEFCEHLPNFHFVANPVPINSNKKSLYQKDGVHFSNNGQKAFVRMLKTHLNPYLGLKPYVSQINSSPNNSNNRFSDYQQGYPNSRPSDHTSNYNRFRPQRQHDNQYEIRNVLQHLMFLLN